MRKIASFILLLAALASAGEVQEFTCHVTSKDSTWTYKSAMIYHDGVLSGYVQSYGTTGMGYMPLDSGEWEVPESVLLRSYKTGLELIETETTATSFIGIWGEGWKQDYTEFSMKVPKELIDISRHKDRLRSEYNEYEDDGLDCISLSRGSKKWSQVRRLK